MNKFRKWFFKFLTGYDLIDYAEILKLAREICDLNKEINEESRQTLKITREANDKCFELKEEVWNVIHELSDIRAQYNLFDEEETAKYHACSYGIKALRKSIGLDEGRTENETLD